MLAGVLGVALPVYQQARLEPPELTDLVPTEYRADAVVTLADGGDEEVMAVVVEIQLGRDADKHWTWPVYVATLRARLRCPVELLVVCTSAAMAAWCARPIALGVSGSQLTPLVLGPAAVPVVIDAAQARAAPELAVLSALAHGGAPGGQAVLEALLGALDGVDEQHSFLYLELVHALLPDVARRYLEGLMTTHPDETKSSFQQFLERLGEERAAERIAAAAGVWEARGEARGEARAIVTMLEARGIAVPEEARERIGACTDPAQLDGWVRRAVTAATADDLFV
jgi:hypothetical protein